MIPGKIAKLAFACFLLAGLALAGCSDDSVRVVSPSGTTTNSIYTPETGVNPSDVNQGGFLDIQSGGNTLGGSQGDTIITLGQSLGDTDNGIQNNNKE